MNLSSHHPIGFLVAVAVTCMLPTTSLSQTISLAELGPVGQVQKVHGGFSFTEGPASHADGSIYFTDIPTARIHRLAPDGTLSVLQESSGHANGLMLAANGELFKCEMDGKVTALNLDTMQQRIVASTFGGKRFNAPNDLVIDKAGGVYFADPHFRAPQPLPQGKTCVYYVTATGKVTRLIDNLKAPNGVILSPDEKTLYVIPSGQAEMMAYPVMGPGELGAGRLFCQLKQRAGQSGRGGDGVTVDQFGNLYIASSLGLQVFNRTGQMLGLLEFPEQPANVTFGGPQGKTLFVTARTGLYKLEMKVTGHLFARSH